MCSSMWTQATNTWPHPQRRVILFRSFSSPQFVPCHPVAVVPRWSFPNRVGILTCFILCRFFQFNPKCCEIMHAASMSCPEFCILYLSSHLHVLIFFLSHFFKVPWFLNGGMLIQITNYNWMFSSLYLASIPPLFLFREGQLTYMA